MKLVAKVSLTKGLEILFLLASHRFGLSRQEICDEIGIGRITFYEYIRALKDSGVYITSQIEPERHGWHKIYRLRTVKGVPFTLTTRLVPSNHG